MLEAVLVGDEAGDAGSDSARAGSKAGGGMRRVLVVCDCHVGPWRAPAAPMTPVACGLRRGDGALAARPARSAGGRRRRASDHSRGQRPAAPRRETCVAASSWASTSGSSLGSAAGYPNNAERRSATRTTTRPAASCSARTARIFVMGAFGDYLERRLLGTAAGRCATPTGVGRRRAAGSASRGSRSCTARAQADGARRLAQFGIGSAQLNVDRRPVITPRPAASVASAAPAGSTSARSFTCSAATALRAPASSTTPSGAPLRAARAPRRRCGSCFTAGREPW